MQNYTITFVMYHSKNSNVLLEGNWKDHHCHQEGPLEEEIQTGGRVEVELRHFAVHSQHSEGQDPLLLLLLLDYNHWDYRTVADNHIRPERTSLKEEEHRNLEREKEREK